MDIYVGNLAYSTTDDSLRAAFAAYGEVTSARVVTDRISHRSKGFGFVEMPNEAEANAAVAALNGAELDGREIRANESQPKPPRREGDFGGRGRFGGGRPPRREGGRNFGDREGGRGFGDREGGRGGFRREGGYGSRGGYGRGPRRSTSYQPQPRESQW